MDYLFGVSCSDEVNRYGYKISINVMEKMVDQTFLEGLPSAVQHDAHRLIGWSMPIGLYVEPGLTRMAGISLLPENNDEYEKISNAYHRDFYRRNEKECSEYRKYMEELLDGYLSENYKCLSNVCTSILDNGIVKSVFPEIFENEDKDKLIPLETILENFEPVTAGLFKSKNSELIIYAHPFFRRSSSRFNKFNSTFLDQLLELKNFNETVNIKIALDEDLIGYAPSFNVPIELDYWYGPKFSKNIENIQEGVTVHLSKDKNIFFHGISRTEFRWKPYKNLRTFEVEELKNIEYPTLGLGNDKFGCRYVHSQFDANKKTFIHFDGALRVYSLEKMRRRLNTDIKKAGKHSKYTKIFRIDGKIELDEWKSLVSNYFRENSLLIEYFDGKVLESKEECETEDKVQKIPHYFLNKIKGVKIGISYHAIDKEYPSKKRDLLILDTLTIEGKIYPVIESGIIEVRKALKKLGEDLEIPKNVRFIKFTDLYLNIPIIRHGKDNLPENLFKTIKALKLVMGHIKSDMIISFTLSWPTKKKEVRLSILGHLTDILDFLNKFGDEMPILDNQIDTWLEEVSNWLTDNYPESVRIDPLSEIFQPSGVILIKRYDLLPSMLNKSFYYYEWENSDLNFIKDEKLVNTMKNYSIQTATSFFLDKSSCNKCKDDYRTCKHSKYLDNVSEIINYIEPISVFLTDKKELMNRPKRP